MDGQYKTSYLFGIGLVGSDGEGARPPAFDLPDEFRRRFRRSDITERHIGAVFSQTPDDGRADTARSARDEYNLTLEFVCHVVCRS